MQKYIYLGIAHQNLDAVYMHGKLYKVSFEDFKSAFTENLEIYWGKSFETCYNPISDIKRRYPTTDYIIFQFKRTDIGNKTYLAIGNPLDCVIGGTDRFYQYLTNGWIDIIPTTKKSNPIDVSIDMLLLYANDVVKPCVNNPGTNWSKTPFILSDQSLNSIKKKIRNMVDCEVINTVFRMDDILMELDDGSFAVITPMDDPETYQWRYTAKDESLLLQEKYSIDNRWKEAFHEN